MVACKRSRASRRRLLCAREDTRGGGEGAYPVGPRRRSDSAAATAGANGDTTTHPTTTPHKVASGLIRSPRSRSLNRAHLEKCRMEWILATGIDFAFCGCVVRVLFPVASLLCPHARTGTVSDWGGASYVSTNHPRPPFVWKVVSRRKL